jgi:hypothetical protein
MSTASHPDIVEQFEPGGRHRFVASTRLEAEGETPEEALCALLAVAESSVSRGLQIVKQVRELDFMGDEGKMDRGRS